MKRIYSLYAVASALVFAGRVILLAPPRTVYACGYAVTALAKLLDKVDSNRFTVVGVVSDREAKTC